MFNLFLSLEGRPAKKLIGTFENAEAALHNLRRHYSELFIDQDGECFDVLAVFKGTADVYAIEPAAR
jgi:hypothetical protein